MTNGMSRCLMVIPLVSRVVIAGAAPLVVTALFYLEQKMKIKNWTEFQHFKDRTPPWIKLYRHLLDDPDWHNLSGNDAKNLVMLWLIASEDKDMQGNLPDIRNLAFRLRISESETKQTLTKLSHWLLQDDINVISECYQDDTPERETEREESKSRDKTSIPENFTISNSVRKWADENKYLYLEKHLENFVLKCKAKNYQYSDWDSAFMAAIKENWAGLSRLKKELVN